MNVKAHPIEIRVIQASSYYTNTSGENKPVSYNSNPEDEPMIWTTNLGRKPRKGTKRHAPCGHWHKF